MRISDWSADVCSSDLLALGDSGPDEKVGNTELRFVPYQSEEAVVASFYHAADIYLHAAHADNFPTTLLEAAACGLPVVATAVGGIPEQVESLDHPGMPRGDDLRYSSEEPTSELQSLMRTSYAGFCLKKQ